jgi:hypothetical protein
VKEQIVKFPRRNLSAAAGLALLLLAFGALPLGCKDEDPCDPGQELVGTGCFPIASGGSAGSSSGTPGGAPSEAGAAGEASPGGSGSGIEPPGNPDAMFGTTCASNADCGGPAPICATDPLYYCTQIDCLEGEENAGVCPANWVCIHIAPNPSACVNSQSL